MVPRARFSCCAFATKLPLHLGSAHVPLYLDLVATPSALGHHSYSRNGELFEHDGLIYTRHGGFIDLGHLRDNGDLAAFLATRLRPLLERGEGEIALDAKGGGRRVRVIARAPAGALTRTSDLLAQRIAFELSVWTELVQAYGLTKFQGANESYSAFSPEDLYSGLLGTYLGIAALESPLPYDRAFDVSLEVALSRLGGERAPETRRVLWSVAGRWWDPGEAWPSARLTRVRSFDIGPRVHPMLAPPDGEPVALEVPQADASGTPLSAYYRLEITPSFEELPRLRGSAGPVVTADDLPRLVDAAREQLDAFDGHGSEEGAIEDPLGHYLVGLRLFELQGTGAASAAAGAWGGSGGGSVTIVRADTRGGDFSLLPFEVLHSSERGLVVALALLRTEALYFCRDPDRHAVGPPLVSMLGPCTPHEWLGVGGSLAEALHDGATGRTAVRPISVAAVINPLANGQAPSYDALRLLVRPEAAVEHVWTADSGGTTIPRAGGTLSLQVRTLGMHLEARGAAGYHLDPLEPRDASFESNVRLRYYFLAGGSTVAPSVERIEPWGVASLGVEGSYAYWARPEHAYPEIAAPFVSALVPTSWQLLATATLGFEDLTF